MSKQYPVVLLHGMFGFGQQQSTENVLPYFGIWKSHIRKMFDAEGVHTVAPSLGPFTGAWDRACEAYAQLVGGTVDYGKAHAEKYGHARYGRTYEALLPEWGTTDENGDIIKANLIGHSFGGVTSRMLTELLINGSEEERIATDPDDLSPLFAGGHDWVHSITALAAPHNGMTSVEGKVGAAMTQICRGICDFMNVLDATPLHTIYSLELDHWGITPPPGRLTNPLAALKDKEIVEYLTGEDNIIYDLTLTGAAKRNRQIPMQDHVYYFSHYGKRTVHVPVLDWELPKLKSFPLLNVLGFFMGIQKDGCPDKSWHANDMVINSCSALHPDGTPARDVTAATQDFKPGIWNVFPVEPDMDHMSFLGWTQTKAEVEQFYHDIYNRVSSLPTLNK